MNSHIARNTLDRTFTRVVTVVGCIALMLPVPLAMLAVAAGA